jgi:hypothetical protein
MSVVTVWIKSANETSSWSVVPAWRRSSSCQITAHTAAAAYGSSTRACPYTRHVSVITTTEEAAVSRKVPFPGMYLATMDWVATFSTPPTAHRRLPFAHGWRFTRSLAPTHVAPAVSHRIVVSRRT